MNQIQLYGLLMLLDADIINMLIKRKNMTYSEAAKVYYSSRLYEVLEDHESGLWHLNVEHLYSLLEEELSTGKITFPMEQS